MRKFDLDAVAVTAGSAARLERDLPASQTLFDAYSQTVISLDYIKADRRRESFARACPDLVVVDEAHACVGTHKSRQQHFALLKRLAEDTERHLILLTATPHGGDEEAFDRLLSLLDKEFSAGALDNEAVRTRLARHFVQRRRIDITGRGWDEDRVFPRHDTAERPYSLTNEHRLFHEAVLDYCLGFVEGAGGDQHRRRLAFWATLALMRCVGSSPAAAASALRNRRSAAMTKSAQEAAYSCCKRATGDHRILAHRAATRPEDAVHPLLLVPASEARMTACRQVLRTSEPKPQPPSP